LSDRDTAPGDPASPEDGSPDALPPDALPPDAPHTPAAKPAAKQENPLTNIMVNVLIPVVALSVLSKETGKPWHIGPLYGMIVAVAFPLCYGFYDLITKRKVNFFSVLGVISVLLTGGITIYVWKGIDGVADNAATLFAIKEACIPIVFGVTILASHWTTRPLVRVFLYTPEIFDIPRIEKKVHANDHQPRYEQILFQTTLIMSASFFISALANYFLAQHFLAGQATRVEYNAAIGKLTGWGFLVIGVPCLALWMFALFRLIRSIKSMTGLDTDSIMVPR
jgi:hypothetical protein